MNGDLYSAVGDIHKIGATNARVLELEWALGEVNRRICEDIQPLIDFMNAHKGDPGFREAYHAYQWGVYGTAVHAQIALAANGLVGAMLERRERIDCDLMRRYRDSD